MLKKKKKGENKKARPCTYIYVRAEEPQVRMSPGLALVVIMVVLARKSRSIIEVLCD